MNSVKRKRLLNTIRYTWPYYIVSALIVVLLMNFIFSFTHRLPAYQTLTLFISGEVKDDNGLKEELFDKYKEKELKSITIISSRIDDANYRTKLSVPGYNSSDILIIPLSICNDINVSSFALELNEELIQTCYPSYHFYSQDNGRYGIKINNESIDKYITLPNEECYLFLNEKSENIGQYSTKGNKDHDIVLNIASEWGI